MSGLYQAAGIVALLMAFLVMRRYWRSVSPKPRKPWHQ
jgi:hypothetical protein